MPEKPSNEEFSDFGPMEVPYRVMGSWIISFQRRFRWVKMGFSHSIKPFLKLWLGYIWLATALYNRKHSIMKTLKMNLINLIGTLIESILAAVL